MIENFRNGSAALPTDARVLGGTNSSGSSEYYRQLMAMQRVVNENQAGGWNARWDNNKKADHFAHAEVYAWAAQNFDRKRGINQTVRV